MNPSKKRFNLHMKFLLTIFLFVTAFTHFHCKTPRSLAFKPKEIYKSPSLVILQIAANSFQHISYKQTNDFGNVPCNGLIVRNGNETIVFDTPTTDEVSLELIRWIKDSLRCSINAVIPTHFHDDCLGGLQAFHQSKIPSYGYFKTIDLAKQSNLTAPQNSFTDSLMLNVGSETIVAKFFGEGHTKDNVVGYFASDRILFGGCLLKELNASKGYLGDANLQTWSATVANVKAAYPQLQLVVPGHGKHGDASLLDYTIKLFKVN